MSDILKAPFPYFGGKSRIASLVWGRFGEPQNYCEPFFGSGAVLLGCPWPGHTETVNDACGLLANFWRALQHAPDEVAAHADWPVNECIPAGTMIATPAGDIPVEQITPGMLVWGERDGRVVATRVTATKQSQASEFYDIGPLRVTGNHPIWTAEQGYQEARLLTTGMRIAMFNSPVDKLDLVMLYYPHECATMGNLHTHRPAHQSGAICGRDISRQEAIQRTPVAGCGRRQDTPRLLDTLPDRAGLASSLSGDRTGARRRLARIRATMDSTVSGNLRSGQSYRWRRWDAGLYPYAGTTPEVVCNACWRALSARSCFSNEGQAAHARSPRQDQRGWCRAQAYRPITREVVQRPQGQGAIRRPQSETLGLAPGQATSARTQAEDRRVYHEPQASALCGNGASLSLSDRSSARPGSDRGIGQPGNPQGLPLQRESLSVPVAVYNFQTDTHNYFANRILVHNCDLHARHRWLVDRRPMVEELLADPDWYDAKAAGWWVWGISQWIGTGWCPVNERTMERHKGARPHLAGGESNYGMGVHRVSLSRKMPHLQGDSGATGQGVHSKRLAQKRPAIGGRGHPGSVGGVHGKRLSQQMPKIGANGVGADSMSSGVMHQEYRDEPSALYDYFRALSARLRRVRVVCGDFARILGPSVTWRHGMTAVMLDPPYADAEHAISYSGGGNVWERVTAWCEENGDNPLLRIALCGYKGTWEAPAGWTAVKWRTSGGYGSQGNARGRANAAREVVWFSPACIDPAEDARGALSRPIAVRASDWAGTMFEEADDAA